MSEPLLTVRGLAKYFKLQPKGLFEAPPLLRAVDGVDFDVDMNPKSYFLLFNKGGTLRWMNADTRREDTGTWWFDGINVNLRLTDEEIYTAAITSTSLQKLNGKGPDIKAYGGFVRTTFRATCRK